MNTNLENYFAPFAERLDKFISIHNLEVVKYKHGMSLWNLFFQHPKGGCGKIDVGTDGEQVLIMQWWTLDDYEALARRSKSKPWQTIKNPHECLEDKLIEAIKEVMEWDEKDLEPKGGIAPGPWQNPDQRHQYPIPIL